MAAIASCACAADNELTPAEKSDGWLLLFDGKSTTGWKNNTDKPIAAKLEDGTINPRGRIRHCLR
jgi:hypothetical protein